MPLRTFVLMASSILALVLATQTQAATPAQQRVVAAGELQRMFDASAIKGMELRFIVRGTNCDVLHIESLNLYPEMMEALANGTVIYGKVLPGGVNNFAFGRGFQDVVYTTRIDKAFTSYGPTKLKRDRALMLRTCTDAVAATVTAPAGAGPKPTPPPFTSLSWATAVPGQKLYSASYEHMATIVSVDKQAGLITVKYVKGGTVEPKLLDAVANFWYVKR